jgi:hypothetical protein
MGTWGATAFEDDTAMGFYDDFCSSEQSLKDLESCIDTIIEREYNMKELLMEGFTEPVHAIVSAEIIAAALGKAVNTFPDEEYHNEMELPKINLSKLKALINEGIKDKAKKALIKIRDAKNIHLTVLWLESESFDEWKDYINDLISRLG